MQMRQLFMAGALGLGLAAGLSVPALAEVLRVVQGTTSQALEVPMNRAVVLESDVPFAELSIANPGIADISTLSDRSIYVLGKTPGRTTLTLLSAEGDLITNVEVQVTTDIAEFKERLNQILPGEKIEVRTANDGIVLSGTVSSAQKLSRALDLGERYAPGRVSNLMSVGGTQQVMLKVRFAEMQRSVAKNLSSSLSIRTPSNRSEVTSGALRPTTPTPPGLGDLNPLLNTDGEVAALVGFTAGSLQVGILLEALENKGLVRTLAEPNLTALSGQQASFLAGGEYPVPVSDDGTIKIDYKPFGVEMKFTPTVVDGDLINLQIAAAVSSIDSTISTEVNNLVLNAFKRRETQTTVEMRDGESFAIAGLLQDDFRSSAGQIPWLGDLPVLGALFRSSDYLRAQSELVIVVTPHLVSPTRGEAIALPTDRIRLPSERDLFLFGNVGEAATTGASGEVARQDFTGSYGYVME